MDALAVAADLSSLDLANQMPPRAAELTLAQLVALDGLEAIFAEVVQADRPSGNRGPDVVLGDRNHRDVAPARPLDACQHVAESVGDLRHRQGSHTTTAWRSASWRARWE